MENTLKKSRTGWNDKEVETMLNLIREKHCLKRNEAIFEEMAKDMKSKGFRKNAIQIRSKFKALMTDYDKIKRTDGHWDSCLNFHLLNEISPSLPIDKEDVEDLTESTTYGIPILKIETIDEDQSSSPMHDNEDTDSNQCIENPDIMKHSSCEFIGNSTGESPREANGSKYTKIFKSSNTRTIANHSSMNEQDVDSSSSVHSNDSIKSYSDNQFKNIVIQKLTEISCRLEVLETSVKRLENLHLKNGMRDMVEEVKLQTEEENSLPLKTMRELNAFEKKLNSIDFRTKMVCILRRVGGNDVNLVAQNLMKRVFEDSLAELFSWEGRKKKRVFKNLKTAKLLKTVIYTLCKPQCSDVVIKKSFSQWLAQAKTRRIRKNQCCNVKRMKQFSCETNNEED